MFKSPRAGLDVMKLSIIQKRNVLELILYLNGKQDIFIILINFSSRTKEGELIRNAGRFVSNDSIAVTTKGKCFLLDVKFQHFTTECPESITVVSIELN